MKTILSAAIIAVAIIAYGLMQMRIADAQRYELRVIEWGSTKRLFKSVFDKRTGRVYFLQDGGCYDVVNGVKERKGWDDGGDNE